MIDHPETFISDLIIFLFEGIARDFVIQAKELA